jgi:TetR/AcrR family transcriptional regulator
MGIAERKEREREQRRNAIIDAAEKVFFTKGIANSTMDDVAAEAELSKGTLYLYFMNKEDLHYALCLRGLDIMAAELRKAYSKTSTGADNILAIAVAYLAFTEKFPDYFNAIMSFESSSLENVDPKQRDYILKPSSPLTIFTKIIEEGGRDGSIRQDIPSRELAVILWSQVNGVLQFLRCKSSFLSMLGCTREEMVTDQLKILTNGILVK